MAKRGELAKIISKNIRLTRERLGMSQKDLAAKTKLTARYISILETKGRNLTVATVESLASALGTPACELMCPGRSAVSDRDAIELAIEALHRIKETV